MKSAVLIAAAATSALSIVSVAHAQEMAPPTGRRVAAPKNALELGVGVGYNQGVGDITNRSGDRVQDFSGAGIGAEVDVGYRFSPAFMLGLYGLGTEYNANNSLASGTNVRDLTAGIQANWHFMPFGSIDPWVGLGSGYHGYWVVPDSGPNTIRQGLELARVRAGVDYRIRPEVSVGPFIGADASLFLSEKLPGDTSFHAIDGEKVNYFFFAGLGGRFDTIGQAIPPPSNVASR